MKSKNPKKFKICVACSPGGHMVQARQLAEVYERYDYFYFTFASPVARELMKTAPVRTIPNITKYKPLSWLTGFIRSGWIILKERPNLVISTGAGVVLFLCLFAKLSGAKLIFLESMAKVEEPTLTGRLLYPFSDLFLVQWPRLLRFFPRAKYHGRLF